ncbi:uncharacterized protein LOC100907499 [Galendromus occidentalis]|uniref:Serine/threonine-protein kinase greatwall n=1 Tax=Galendromus occidentalis TaxID=34638 RepID=A0AAJ6QQ35_9ACAR|nr:uncharacterized protein LOC100907499 [Galendromus occidentalis]
MESYTLLSNRQQNAARINYHTDKPKAVEACTKLLQSLLPRLEKTDLQNSPAKQFAIDQTFLGATEMHRMLLLRTLTYATIQDFFNNLMRFLSDRLAPTDQQAAVGLAQVVQQVLMAVSEVCNLLERSGGVDVTDWKTASEVIINASAPENQQAKIDTLAYVIPLDEFENPVLIGLGQFSRIYRLRWRPIDSYCAMKIVPHEKFNASLFRQRYVDKTVAAIAHDPCLIKVHCVFSVKPDSYVMVMDVGSRPRYDLQRILRELDYLKDASVGLISLQIILALESLHLNGFVHRDLNCANVLVDSHGHIKLIDFDSARICSGHFMTRVIPSFFQRTAEEFHDSESVATSAYRAPELLKGSPYGRASDWWSLGVLIYKISTGKYPYRLATESPTGRRSHVFDVIWPEKKFAASELTKQFTNGLLQKKASRRLGSRSYEDIKKHAFFEYFLAMLQALPVKKRKKIQMFTNPRHRMFLNRCLIDFSKAFENLHEHLDDENCETVSIEMIQDETPARHLPLMTYASIKFRKLIDRLSSGEKELIRLRETLLAANTPPELDMDYSTATDSEGREECDRVTAPQSDVTRSPARFPVMKPFLAGGEPLVRLMVTPAEAGFTVPVVQNVSVLEDIGSTIIEGDIVISIRGELCLDKSVEEVYALTQVSDEITKTVDCEVASKTVFRLIEDDQDNALRYMESATRSTMRMLNPSVPSVPSGFLDDHERSQVPMVAALKTRSFNLRGSGGFANYHAIIFVHSDLQVSPPEAALFHGDVLIGINETKGSFYDEAALENIFRRATQPVQIEILETSALRNSNGT